MDTSNNDNDETTIKQPPPPPPLMSEMDVYQICRLCLNTLNADEGESVFNNQVPSLPEKIYRVFGVNSICILFMAVLLTGRKYC